MARKRETVDENQKATGEEASVEQAEPREDPSHPPASQEGDVPGPAPEEMEEPEELKEAEKGPALSADVPEEEGEEPPEEDSLELVRSEMARLQDQHLRLAADFENYRKRVTADLAGSWARAQAELARSLLDGLDDLQRVSRFTTDDTTVEAIIEGVDLVERKLFRAMAEAGLEALEPVREAFDPNIMEAVMRVPTGEDGEDDTVDEVFQKGYKFKDLLIRPARVSVFKDDD